MPRKVFAISVPAVAPLCSTAWTIAEAAEIANALRGMTVADTPKGQGGYTFQEYNNQARSAMTIANPIPTKDEFGESWGAAVMPSTPVATIGADGTTIPMDSEQMNCSL